MLAERLRLIKTIGAQNAVKLLWRRFGRQRARCFEQWKGLFAVKRGLEIGGPSALFAGCGPLPFYAILAHLDNCVFSAHTAWLSEAKEGYHFRYDPAHRNGYQYICDGTDLAPIAAASYDCVLSCNNLEHIANPLKALREWSRVLNSAGALAVVVPAKEYTFDHRRPVTTLGHLVDDYRRNVNEHDLSHLDGILSLHDLSRDRAAGSRETFRQRCERNSEFRCMHHHVFDPALLADAIERVGLRVCAVEPIPPFHIAAIARKELPDESETSCPLPEASATLSIHA